jgi:hypothetical protein
VITAADNIREVDLEDIDYVASFSFSSLKLPRDGNHTLKPFEALHEQ